MSASWRSWTGRGLRFSIVVAVVAAGLDAWKTKTAYDEAKFEELRLTVLYRCVAKQPDDLARKHLNSAGNIDARALGCSDRPSWVSPAELADVRAGKPPYLTSRQPFYLWETLGYALGAFLGCMVLVLAVMGAVWVARWVWGTRSG